MSRARSVIFSLLYRYVPHISEQFKNIVERGNARIAYTGLNKMNFIRVHKDPLRNENKSNIQIKIIIK